LAQAKLLFCLIQLKPVIMSGAVTRRLTTAMSVVVGYLAISMVGDFAGQFLGASRATSNLFSTFCIFIGAGKVCDGPGHLDLRRFRMGHCRRQTADLWEKSRGLATSFSLHDEWRGGAS
jgi:hypothetical protein